MGVSSSFYVALTGMRMSQSAIEVVSHNIANVNTPGYSRQRINLATMPTWPTGWGAMGTGVNANNISRFHDDFLTRNLITKSSVMGQMTAQKSSIDALETYFNESSGGGVHGSLNSFWNSWERVSQDPEGNPVREELIQRLESIKEQVRLKRNDMDLLNQELNKKIDDGVKQVNALTKDIAALNQEIMVREDLARNQEANDLRDSRDELLRQLAELMDIQYYEDPHDGSVTVSTPKGVALVLRETAYKLSTGTDDKGDVAVYAAHNQNWHEDITATLEKGAIGGWVQFRDETLREYYIKYDSFVDEMIFNINNQHAQGAGQEFYQDITATSLISNRPAIDLSFLGEDNDLRITALATHLNHMEPYEAINDPENISIRFVKADQVESEISSSVVFNKDRQKWEITVTLPRDSNGNVTATSQDVIRHINSEKTPTPDRGVPTLPPQTTWPYKIGDFIEATSSHDNNWDGLINFYGNSNPPGYNQFHNLDRTLQHMLPQGHHLSYGQDFASLKANITGPDNEVIFTAYEKGNNGENISVEYVDGGPNQAFALNLTSLPDGKQKIVVTLATDAGGQVLTNAADIVKAVNEHPQIHNLVSANTPQGQSGLGPVKAMPETFLDRSGSFEIVMYDENNEPTFHRVTVNPDDTLKEIVNQIGTGFGDGIPGLRAEIITDRHGRDTLRLIAERDTGTKFGFANDTSGALAVLGLNNVLTGSNSSDIGLNQTIVNNRRLLAAGRIDANGELKPGDNSNALDMSGIKDKRFSFYQLNSATLGSAFGTLYSDIGATNQTITRNYDFSAAIYSQLQDQQDMLAGVNIDEELADVLRFQYMYQASAKMISTVDTMMETLLAMR